MIPSLRIETDINHFRDETDNLPRIPCVYTPHSTMFMKKRNDYYYYSSNTYQSTNATLSFNPSSLPLSPLLHNVVSLLSLSSFLFLPLLLPPHNTSSPAYTQTHKEQTSPAIQHDRIRRNLILFTPFPTSRRSNHFNIYWIIQSTTETW